MQCDKNGNELPYLPSSECVKAQFEYFRINRFLVGISIWKSAYLNLSIYIGWRGVTISINPHYSFKRCKQEKYNYYNS